MFRTIKEILLGIQLLLWLITGACLVLVISEAHVINMGSLFAIPGSCLLLLSMNHICCASCSLSYYILYHVNPSPGGTSHLSPGGTSHLTPGSTSHLTPGGTSHQSCGGTSHPSPGGNSHPSPGGTNCPSPGSISCGAASAVNMAVGQGHPDKPPQRICFRNRLSVNQHYQQRKLR